MDIRLDDRPAVVTGAGSGIGAGIAVALADAGAPAVLVGRDERRLEETRKSILERGGNAETVVSDLLDDLAHDRIVSRAVDSFGRIRIVVHAAGLFRPKPFSESTLDDFDAQWRTNVRVPYALTQAALPQLRDGGAVILISSMFGLAGHPNCVAYCATKGAVEAMGRALANEFAAEGVRVNTVAPGAIETPMNEDSRKDVAFYEKFRNFPPARRWGRVEDIAPAVVFLASDAASFIHGATIAVDGGWNAK